MQGNALSVSIMVINTATKNVKQRVISALKQVELMYIWIPVKKTTLIKQFAIKCLL